MLSSLLSNPLVDEYCRSILFGANGSNRREISALTPLLKNSLGVQFETFLKELENEKNDILKVAEEAKAFAENGGVRNSCEYEEIILKVSEKMGVYGRQYVNTVFQNAQKPLGGSSPKAVKAGKSPKKVSNEESSVKRGASAGKGADKALRGKLNEYQKVGLWDEGESKGSTMRKLIVEMREICSDEQKLQAEIQKADAWIAKAAPLAKKAIYRSSDTPEELAALEKLGGVLTSYIAFKRQKNASYQQKQEVSRNHAVDIVAPSVKKGNNANKAPAKSHANRALDNCPGHVNEIFRLVPEKEWDLYIDESGKDEDFSSMGTGVIAGVLCSTKEHLPQQPKLHAATNATEEKMRQGDRVIETMLNHKNCGVLAIPAFAYDSAQGWGSLIASFIDIVLRLLPMSAGNEKVKLHIYLEQRDPYSTAFNFDFIKDACRYNLMHLFPERADRIEFDMQVMDKQTPYDAYPDLVANTCFSGSRAPRSMPGRRLQQAGWNGTCFLNYPARELRNILDFFFTGRNISAEEWDALLKAKTSEDGLVPSILKTIGLEAQKDLSLWKSYLSWTVSHLSSKAINLRVLSSQLDWLREYEPAEAELPPRVKLLWLTSKLAEANHLGAIESQSPVGNEFMRLIRKLYEEDAPLACWAILHLAVQKTNAFQFAEAKKLVRNFCDMGELLPANPVKNLLRSWLGVENHPSYKPAAIPGLRYYGQLLSSCGQHEAFLGNQTSAIVFFKAAIGCFERLSENKMLDIDQTMSYYAIAQMDKAPGSRETREVMERYLGMPLDEACRKMASSVNDIDKYHHHILLRYLVLAKPESEIKTYLGLKAQWHVGYGHPWEMIEFYRALLLDNAQERDARLESAYDIAREDSGLTLQVIACVILGAAIFFGKKISAEAYLDRVEYLSRKLPDLGQKRIKALKAQATAPMEPLALAKTILPFNFR